MPYLPAGEGRLPVRGGEIWFNIVGEENGLPLVLLHGGPGGPSYYLNPLEALGRDRPVVFFDQLGCGRSDRISDPGLMTIEAHVAQVERLREALGLDSFILYGQSWGGALAAEYYFAHPETIRALIFSSPLLSFPLWTRDAGILISTLPAERRDAIRNNERTGTYDDPGYQEAMRVYYRNFVLRRAPWPEDVEKTFAGMGTNVYQAMWGPSEFTATGPLRDYDSTGRLGEIRVPTLFLAGEFDEARPETVRYFQSLVPGAAFALIPAAAHLTMQDNPEADLAALSGFLAGLGTAGRPDRK